jgi:hypothetical protein
VLIEVLMWGRKKSDDWIITGTFEGILNEAFTRRILSTDHELIPEGCKRP